MGISLPIINSDHAPIVFKPKPSGTSGTSFKYEAYWEDPADCKQVIADSWTSTGNGASVWSVLDSKLKKCKQRLN